MSQQFEGLQKEVETTETVETTEKEVKVQSAEEKEQLAKGVETLKLFGFSETIEKVLTVVPSWKDADEDTKKAAKKSLVDSFGSVNETRIAVKAASSEIETLEAIKAATDLALKVLGAYDKEPKPEKVKAEKTPKIKNGIVVTVQGGISGNGETKEYIVAGALLKEAKKLHPTDTTALRAYIFTEENAKAGLYAEAKIQSLEI